MKVVANKTASISRKNYILITTLGIIFFALLAGGLILFFKDALFKGKDTNITVIHTPKEGPAEVAQHGYYLGSSSLISEGKELQRLFFVTAKIQNISVENNHVILNLGIKINGQQVVAQIITTKFIILKNTGVEGLNPNEYFDQINYQNTNLVDLNANYQPLFYYIPTGNKVATEDLSKYCKSKEILELDDKAICDPVISNPPIMETELNDYIKAKVNENKGTEIVFDKLIFSTLYKY